MAKRIEVVISGENAELLRALSGSATGLKNFSKEAKSAEKSVSGMGGAFTSFSVTAGSLIYTLQQIRGAFTSLIGPAFEFTKTLETSQYGMAGILISMGRVNGRALTFNEAMGISAEVIQKLNDEALRTAATSEELVGVYQAILAPGLAAKMTMQQIMQLTVVGTNAVKSMGLPTRQIIQELRDLVQGGIQPASSQLATSLGLTDADIKKARDSSQGLFAFLMERLKGFEVVSGKFGDTLQGKMDQLKEGATRTMSAGIQPLVDYFKQAIGELADQFFTFDQKTKTVKLNPELVKTIQEISAALVSLSKDIGIVAGALKKIGFAEAGEEGQSWFSKIVDFLKENLIPILVAVAAAVAIAFGGSIVAAFGAALAKIWGLISAIPGVIATIGMMFGSIVQHINGAGGGIFRALTQSRVWLRIAGEIRAAWELVGGVITKIGGYMAKAAAGVISFLQTKGLLDKGRKENDKAELDNIMNTYLKNKAAGTLPDDTGDATIKMDDIANAYGPPAGDGKGAHRIAKAKRELENAIIDAEYNALKKGIEIILEQEKAAYDDRLTSTRQYFAKKQQLDAQGIEAEIARKRRALAYAEEESKSAETEEDRIKGAADVARIKGEIAVLEQDRAQKTWQNIRAQAEAEKALRESYEDIYNRLMTLQNNKAAAKKAEIEKQYREKLERALADGDTKAAQAIRDIISIEGASADYDEIIGKIEVIRAKMQNEILPVQQAIDRGNLDDITGKQRIVDITAKYSAEMLQLLPLLEKAANASMDPKKIQSAKQLGIETTEAAKKTNVAWKTVGESIKKNFEDAFVAIVTGAKNAGDAFRDMANAILADMARMLAKKLSTSLFGSGFAAGGLVTGPGSGTSDSVPIWASNGEYVIPAATVRRLGVGFFDALRGGIATAPTRGRFATGGLVSGGAGVEVNVPVAIYGEASNSLANRLRSEIEDTARRIIRQETGAA